MARDLAFAQWAALVVLTVGVAIGQWQGGTSDVLDASTPFIGVLLMLLNSSLSALGGVCTEKVLKSRGSAQLSIFATNVHMAGHTLLLNGGFLFLQALASGEGWPEFGAPPGRLEALALGNEALNGILISQLMRRIDSIAKNYAFSASVFVTAMLSAAVLDHRPSWNFYVGALVTLASMGLY
eukprot:CAMPEP_0115556414 /NCGR_PEP_ID=MMETSP0271-20121206/98353_1 /TAXON_ID=71861 /ORGANISM="Scrippsiella trochoidea, Strain CCMP3099" /LENGTH=181 /DNA_ID=CAMNT_0002990283 /DNA_START=54 /DNA_END=596 /DNA_ORIENTATION=-